MPTSLDISIAPTQKSRWSVAFSSSLRQNLPLLAIIFIFLNVANGLAAWLGRPYGALDGALGSCAGFGALCAATFTVAFLLRLIVLVVKHDLKLSNGEALVRLFGEFFNRERVLLTLPILAAWPVLAMSFSLVKTLLPDLNPFYLDPALHAADRLIHFGQDPWALLQPILGHPIVSTTLDRLYAIWMLVMYLSLLSQIVTTKNQHRRMQFLLSNMLAWILLGSLGAVLLSSVGPCFYQHFYGIDAYAAQMTYLREVVPAGSFFGFDLNPLMATNVQDILLHEYETNTTGFGRGISAAPSMHVASTWLIARMAQSYGKRWLTIAGWTFFGCILVGSVHLGWHYALDGYISIAATWSIWRLTGWLLAQPRVKGFLWPNSATA